jgi:hypothetical protein
MELTARAVEAPRTAVANPENAVALAPRGQCPRQARAGLPLIASSYGELRRVLPEVEGCAARPEADPNEAQGHASLT